MTGPLVLEDLPRLDGMMGTFERVLFWRYSYRIYIYSILFWHYFYTLGGSFRENFVVTLYIYILTYLVPADF